MKPENSHAIKCLDDMTLQVDLVELSSFPSTDVAVAVRKPGDRCQTIIRALSAFVLFRSSFNFPEIDERCIFRSDNCEQLVVRGPGEKCNFKIARERFLV